MAKKKSQPSKAKAAEMLHNPPHGVPLTDKQRKYFGYLANANIGMKIPNENNSNVSLPKGFNGFGYYSPQWKSPAWGGQFQFGGNLPGAVGNMYARIGAPTNGKYAKKTLPSAQDGNQLYPVEYWKKQGVLSPDTLSRGTMYRIPYSDQKKLYNIPIPPNSHPNDVGFITMPSSQNPNMLSRQNRQKSVGSYDIAGNPTSYSREQGSNIPTFNHGGEVSPYYIHGNDFVTKGMQMGGYLGSEETMLKNALFDERNKKRDSVRINLNRTYTNPIDYDKINTGMLNYFQTEPREYKSLDVNALTPQRKKQLLQKKKGGVVKDNMGYWNPDNQGKVVQIDSPNITMQGVNQPLLGVSNSGHIQMMHPGNDYKFDGSTVTEYPIMQNGGKANENILWKIHNLSDKIFPVNDPNSIFYKHENENMNWHLQHPHTIFYNIKNKIGEYLNGNVHEDGEITKPNEQNRGQKKKLTQLTDFSNNNNMEQAKSGIHINPKNKGKFNALKKKTGKTTEELTHSKNPLTRKRAIFAQNAKKWKHEEGGEVKAQYGGGYGNYQPYQPNFNQYNPQPVGQYTANFQPLNLGQQPYISQYGNYAAPQLNTQPEQQTQPSGGGGGMMGGLGQGMDVVGNVIKGIKMIGQEKKQRQQADQFRQVSNIVAQAASTRPEPIKRKYTRPEDVVVNQNELFPTHGVGTNYLAAYGASVPGEIQNTYAPNNTLYSDLAYEPLNDSNQVKQFQYGGAQAFGEAGGFNLASQIGQSGGGALSGTQYGQPSGGSYTGSTIGGAIGSVFGPVGQMVGSTAGGLIGGAIDQNPRKIRKYTQEGYNNLQRASAYEGVKNMQFQNSSFMKKGGYVNLSHDWNPQVITYFGDHKLKDLLKPDPMMNTLRAGGTISDLTYIPPSKKALQTYGLGGELKVHDGGYAESISHNPYLPDGGETVMFRGKSHENGGIPISFGKNPVEVEGGEPAVKLEDGGGEENLVVFGNMKIPSYGVSELGDKRAKGMKFKNYIDLLSKEENKHNKTISKAVRIADETEPATSFDKLKLTTAQAMLQGANSHLKVIADKKQLASHVQNAILDTAEELGIESDELAKGNIKKSKFGGKFSYTQYGRAIKESDKLNIGGYAQNGDYLPDFVNRQEVPTYQGKGWMLENEKDRLYKDVAGKKGSEEFNKAFGEARNIGDLSYVPPKANISPASKQSNNFDYVGAAGSLFPYFRPTNQIPLDSNQLMGEMYALSNNQLEPVQAQLYHPLLQQPYDISLQDQMNANQSTFNALERQTRYNPAAQSVLAGQKYAANSGVLGEQFRQNQAMKSGVYNQNRNILNDATLKNLAILDQQYQRQSQAKSNTKAVAQQALSSIADKIAKNKLENRTLGVYENLYGYRFDPLGRAFNLNTPAKFNIPTQQSSYSTTDNKGNELLPIYTKKGEISGYKVKESKNGSILKAFHGY